MSAWSAFLMPFLPCVSYGYPSSCPRARCTPNKSVPTLRYTRKHGPIYITWTRELYIYIYTSHACRHLPSAVPWISEDRLLEELLLREPASSSSTKLDEAMFGIQNTSLDVFWELFTQFDQSCLWLVESKESCPVDEEERTRKKNINWWQCWYFTRFGGNWPICWLVGCAALSLGPRLI